MTFEISRIYWGNTVHLLRHWIVTFPRARLKATLPYLDSVSHQPQSMLDPSPDSQFISCLFQPLSLKLHRSLFCFEQRKPEFVSEVEC